MKIFEGKSPEERNKIIVASVLGALALLAIGYNVIGFFPSKKTTVTVSTSPTPTPTASPSGGSTIVSALPTDDEINFQYETTAIAYNGSNSAGAPDAGRNIFAFYEPPPPTPFSPTPFQTPKPTPTPTPVPPPPVLITFLNRQSVYSGEKAFQLEVNGDKFTPDMRVIFNGSEIQTTYVSPQRLVANVSSDLINGEGQRTIMVRNPDGVLYSNQLIFNVQQPPQPQFQYIGMIARKRYNNDTAYFTDPGKANAPPFSARLNDLVDKPDTSTKRFRVISISANEVILEDKDLGFKHRLPLQRTVPGQGTSTTSTRGGQTEYNNNPYNAPYNPTTMPNYSNPPLQNQDIPGIPNNIPRYRPTPVPQPQQQQQKMDKDDEDGDN